MRFGMGDGVSAQVEPLGGTVYHTEETVVPTIGAPISVAVPQLALVDPSTTFIKCPFYAKSQVQANGQVACQVTASSLFLIPATLVRSVAPGILPVHDYIDMPGIAVCLAAWGGLAYLLMRGK